MDKVSYLRNGKANTLVMQKRLEQSPFATDLKTEDLVAGKNSLPRTVLLADDDNTTRMLVSKLLERVGYTVLQASSGEETLSVFDRHKDIDAVLLDVLMPDLNGLEVTKRLRKKMNEDYIPILLLTSLDDTSAIAEGFNAGADEYTSSHPSWANCLHD